MLTQKQPRLKHLSKLRVKSTSPKTAGGPCSVALTNLLSCWASNGHDSPGCQNFAQELKVCMAARVSISTFLFKYFQVLTCFFLQSTAKAEKSSINYHAARLKEKVTPPPYD